MRLKLIEDLVVDHVILGTDDGSFVQKVLELTGAKVAEAVIDFEPERGLTSTGG